MAPPLFSTSSTAPIAQTRSQSSSRLTMAACTARPAGRRRASPPDPPPPLRGTIFRVDPATGAFTTRYRFSGPDGSKPIARLIQGTDGLIYGTTSAGGAYGFGTVFSLDSADTLTTLHHFAGADGANPNAGVIQGLDGRLYGTTSERRRVRLRHRVRHERHRRADDAA